MKLLAFTILAAATGLVKAETASSQENAAPAEQVWTREGMPAGAFLEKLTPKPPLPDPVTVPEPVWASVLAACAVSLLRRVRR
jgi:hypothetical protein